jgi:hypothetical protein
MPNKLPDDVKKRAEAKCADRPHLEIQDPGTVWISPSGLEIQDPGTVWISPSGKVFVFVVDTKTNAPLWVEV